MSLIIRKAILEDLKSVQEFKNYCMSKGIEQIKVTASAKNVNARKFYQNNGFEEFEVIYKMKLEGN